MTKHDIEHVRTPILSAFYGQNQIPPNTNLTWLKGIDTDEFLNKTYSGTTYTDAILGGPSLLHFSLIYKTYFLFQMLTLSDVSSEKSIAPEIGV